MQTGKLEDGPCQDNQIGKLSPRAHSKSVAQLMDVLGRLYPKGEDESAGKALQDENPLF